MHRGPITSVLVSLDNKYVYTAGYDKCIYKWNRETGTNILLGKHRHLVNSICLASNDTLLASASSDYTINIYDTNTNQLVRTLYGHSDDVESVSFAINNSLLVSTSRDKRCLVWDVQTGAIINEFNGHSKDVLSLWVYEDKAFTTGDDGRALVWYLNDSRLYGEIGPFSCELDTVSGNEKMGVFAIGADDGTVIIYDAISLEEKYSIKAHKQGVKRVSFSPSGRYLLTAGYDHLIRIWDYETASLLKELPKYQYQWERSLTWTPDEKYILGASFGKTYCEWSVDQEKLITSETENELATPSINDIAVTDFGDIITASDDGRFRVNGKEIASSTKILTNGVGSSNDGKFIIWGDHSSNAHLLDTNQSKLVSIFLNTGPVNSVFFNNYDGYFYIGTYGGYIHVIDPIVSEEITSWKAHNGAVKSLEADDKVIVSVSSEGSIKIFDQKNPSIAEEYFGPNAIINDVALDSSRSRIVVVSRDKVVRIYDLKTGKILGQHNVHRYSIKSVTITQEGFVVSGDYWGYCVIWNPENEDISEAIRVSSNGISALRSIKDSVFASSYDGAVYKIQSNNAISEVLRLFEQSPSNDKLISM
ncbi:WD40 repeat domain-containing protein [Bacillus toyonensis]|uniref:WD40 repeat domain-containing protein n=1 Tax=Bacillus toyonensis TaxID=155322 RepID=UPI000B4517E5|nr:WD40 repeat domain-containing protein [Bacillus toyonensis]MEC2393470.1 WD40 repeat domain-containing protein [Bacillus toyonensis]OTX28551.1 wd domain protein [Bacillus thuringiensis serovar malayensis]PGE16325.1 WD40 repeat domain-containing protein [Bacillus toyonensis]